jgi:hypothetical protein
MTVALCMSLTYASRPTIEAVLDALVDHNVELYRTGHIRGAPWWLAWVPDELVVCDAVSCKLADTSTLQDVRELYQAGRGSCGPLACAYAAWLRHSGEAARTRLISTGQDLWHVVAVVGRKVYDPQVIGARASSSTQGNPQGAQHG